MKIIVAILMIGVAVSGCKEKPTAADRARWQRTQEMMAKRDAERAHGAAKLEAAKPRILPVVVSASSLDITIQNIGSNTWSSIKIYINGTPPAAHMYHLGPVYPNRPYEIPLSEFTKKDGERFNPAAYKLHSVWIGGGGYDYARYDF